MTINDWPIDENIRLNASLTATNMIINLINDILENNFKHI